MREHRLLIVAITFAVALPACVSAGERGVTTRSIETRIAFGFGGSDETLFTPASLPAPLGAALRPPAGERRPVFSFEPPPPIRSGPCPDVPNNVFPQQAAQDRVDRLPQAGTWSWYNTAQIDGAPVDNLTGFTDRDVDQVRGTMADSGLPAELSYRWRRYHPVFDAQSEEHFVVEQAFEVENPGVPAWTFFPPRHPTEGLRLTSWTLRRGKTVSSFDPVEPVMLLPLPVDPALTWTDTQADVAGGVTVTVNGKLGHTTKDGEEVKEFVNACGTPVEAWVVNLEVTITQGAETVSFPWVFDFVPHLGGLIAQDRFAFDATSKVGTLRVTSQHHVAELEPHTGQRPR